MIGSGRNAYCNLLAGLCFCSGVLLFTGCDFFSRTGVDPKTDGRTAVEKVDPGKEHPPLIVPNGNGRALIRIDVQPQGAVLEAMSPEGREAYLKKRVFLSLDDKKFKTIPNDTKSLAVDIVMMTSVDQYNKSGTPEKVAQFEVDLLKFRKAGRTAAEIQTSEYGDYFLSTKILHENVKAWPLTRITIK